MNDIFEEIRERLIKSELTSIDLRIALDIIEEVRAKAWLLEANSCNG